MTMPRGASEETERQPSLLRRVFAMFGVVLALTVIGLVADLMGIVSFVTGKNGPELAAPASPSAEATRSPAVGATIGTPPTASPEPEATPGQPATPTAGTVYATDLDLLNQASDIDVGSAEIRGEHYGHSVVYRCSLYCDSPRGVVEFNLGGRYKTFEVTVGVLDDAQDADQVGYFEVFVDGSPVKKVSATLGKPTSMKIDLTPEAVRLKLLAYRTDTVDSPLKAGANVAGGRSNGLPELAWGDPRLTA
ncbi:NPCBM/NEW2 domain-containing protein [Micromonospora carbonacea]|uniref:NPCBM/NEW2 domain-containing protein n=1 Tax=Micromonospora carbonacea TaxID=47853 RepID=UPI003D97CE91